MRKKQLDLTLGRLSATNISALKTWNRKHLRCCHNLPSEDQEPGTPIGRRRYRTLTKKKKIIPLTTAGALGRRDK